MLLIANLFQFLHKIHLCLICLVCVLQLGQVLPLVQTIYKDSFVAGYLTWNSFRLLGLFTWCYLLMFFCFFLNNRFSSELFKTYKTDNLYTRFGLHPCGRNKKNTSLYFNLWAEVSPVIPAMYHLNKHRQTK